MASVHSEQSSLLKAPYATAKHGLIGFPRGGGQGSSQAPRLHQCHLPWIRADAAGRQVNTRANPVSNLMVKETVDGEFTITADVAEATLFLAAFESSALMEAVADQSQRWFME